MYQDMSLSGCQWHKDHNHQSSKSRKNASAEVWGHTDEMILNFLEKALDSGMLFVYYYSSDEERLHFLFVLLHPELQMRRTLMGTCCFLII